MERFGEDLDYMLEGNALDDFNWNVWEYDKVCCVDRFFMVKVGLGVNGIVMSGTFSSEPYQDEDWSGKGRKVFYMDMEIEEMIHPYSVPLLTSEELAKEIPDFVWTGGHSGQVLTEEQTVKLQELRGWYLDENSAIFEPRAVVKRNRSACL